MSDPSFPTTLSDLQFQFTNAQNQAASIYKTLSYLRKSTLSIPNRLRSILLDSTFVSRLSTQVYPTYPLVANERAGSWYIPPHLKSGSAYFKSTDGHHGQWAFSLRRLNLEVLSMLGENGGVVLVDSTRRGKDVPDALRRTVVIWVCVWNRILFGDEEERGVREGWWGVQSRGLERSEIAQIEARVSGWIEDVKGLELDLKTLREKLKRPIKCVWVVHGESEYEKRNGATDGEHDEEQKLDYNTLVLCSASRRVLGAEMSEDGYIQGAGDDSEGWSHGLTSALFWAHKDQLMNTPEDDLPLLITQLVKDGKATRKTQSATRITPTANLYLTAGVIVEHNAAAKQYDVIVDCMGSEVPASKQLLRLGCRPGKLGSRDLRDKLAQVKDFVSHALNKDKDCKILVACENGRDISVGVMVMLLCSLYDDVGSPITTGQPNHVDKQLVKKRLAWITSVKPDANPSRSTLQAVNSFLMERPP